MIAPGAAIWKTASGHEMPVVQKKGIRTAGEHDQADDAARHHASCSSLRQRAVSNRAVASASEKPIRFSVFLIAISPRA
jgi:pimeloyl-CoA synthetase